METIREVSDVQNTTQFQPMQKRCCACSCQRQHLFSCGHRSGRVCITGEFLFMQETTTGSLINDKGSPVFTTRQAHVN